VGEGLRPNFWRADERRRESATFIWHPSVQIWYFIGAYYNVK